MTPDKAAQIGNDLCCLAASIAEIGEELKALYDFGQQDRKGTREEPGRTSERASDPQEAPKAPSMEQVRVVLAEKSRRGYTAVVRALLEKHGAAKLSEIDPAEYGALLADAEVLGDG